MRFILGLLLGVALGVSLGLLVAAARQRDQEGAARADAATGRRGRGAL